MNYLFAATLAFSVSANAATASTPCTQPLTAPLTYDTLKAKLQQCQTKSIADVIPLLPVEYVQNYTLMYHSRGLQQSTAAAPRALLFGNDASLVLAYDGSPSEPNYNSLEIMQYRAATQSFEFDAVTFPEDESATTGPVFSETNPAACLACHSSASPKPNWDGYLLWPGAFGGEDEATFIGYRTNDKSSDSADYQTFLANGKLGPRYKLLQPYPHGSLVETPNTNLGDRLQRLNVRRIAATLAQNPKLQPYRYALLAMITCVNEAGQPLTSFLPAALPAVAVHPLKWYESDTTQNQNQDYLARITRLQSYYPNSPVGSRVIEVENDMKAGKNGDLDDSEPVASFRFVIEGLAQGSLANWSTVFSPEAEDLVFNTASVDLTFMEFPLVEALFKNEPAISALYDTAKFDKTDWATDADPTDKSGFYKKNPAQICTLLKQKSLAALANIHP